MIIDFEGLDGCFKTTNHQLLKETLSSLHSEAARELPSITFQQFPRYGKQSASFVETYLKDDDYDRKYCLPLTAVHPFYYLDRFAFWNEKQYGGAKCETERQVYEDQKKKTSHIYLFDRYTYSSMLYQTAEELIREGFKPTEGKYSRWKEKADSLMNQIFLVEKDLIPVADYVIYFYMPITRLAEINAKRTNAGPKDMNDNNALLRATIDWIARQVIFGQNIDEYKAEVQIKPEAVFNGGSCVSLVRFDSYVIPFSVWDYSSNQPKSRVRILGELMTLIGTIYECEKIKATEKVANRKKKEDK